MQAVSEHADLVYAGDISPADAWEMLAQKPDAQLIDVRTQPEWVFSGTPNLQKLQKQVQTISWKLYPTMEHNTEFAGMVASVAPNPDTPLLFLCKTGGRSLDAAVAMTQAGYTRCYNVAGGFEGDRDAQGRRGCVNGWKASELPWEQV